MGLSHLTKLHAHNTWAEETILQFLRRLGSESAEINRLIAHNGAAQEIWSARLLRKTTTTTVFPESNLDEIERASKAALAAVERYVAQLKEADLDRVIEYRTTTGVEQKSTVEDILLHVALHSAHHRGQIARRLRELGHAPPHLDYIHWSRTRPTK